MKFPFVSLAVYEQAIKWLEYEQDSNIEIIKTFSKLNVQTVLLREEKEELTDRLKSKDREIDTLKHTLREMVVVDGQVKKNSKLISSQRDMAERRAVYAEEALATANIETTNEIAEMKESLHRVAAWAAEAAGRNLELDVANRNIDRLEQPKLAKEHRDGDC